MRDDDFDHQLLKKGLKVYYGPVSHYDFELLRHLGGEAGPECMMTGPVDLSVPHNDRLI